MISMKALAEAKGGAAAAGGHDTANTAWRNVAVRPMEYDVANRVTTGVDISTGETVSIRLDEANFKESRDDVHVWSLPRFKESRGVTLIANGKAVVAGAEGGVIIFEAVRSVGPGQPLEARWGNTASHHEGVADVFHALVRPAPDYRNRLVMDQNCCIELIRPMAAKPIKSMNELREGLTEIVSRPFTQAVLRVLDPTDGEVWTGTLFLKKDEPVDHAVKRFLAEDRTGKLMSDTVCEGAVVELLTVERIYPGRDYRKVLSDPDKTDAKIFRRDWSLGEGQGWGFADSIVALRQYVGPNGELGGMQLTKIRPASTRPLIYRSLANLPTPNIRPKVAPVARPGEVHEAEAGVTQQDRPRSDAGVSERPVPAANRAPSDDRMEALSNKLAGAARGFARTR